MVAVRRSIVVAGAHGKTTTTAMIAFAAQRLGLDPTYLIGGEVSQLGGNAGPGGGELLVAEADESDGSLALLRPAIAVVTNIELDHHTRFGSEEELRELFAGWAASVPAGGAVLLGDGVDLPFTVAASARFGFSPGADWHISGLELTGPRTGFWLATPDATPLHVSLRVPGAHNAQNAAAAIAALHHAGADAADAATAIGEFRGAGRRFERRGERRGFAVVDDYAHHPTELEATIATARSRASAARGGVFPAAPVLAHAGAGWPLRCGPGAGRRGGRDRDLRGPRAAAAGGDRQAGGGRRQRAPAGHAAGLLAYAGRRRPTTCAGGCATATWC